MATSVLISICIPAYKNIRFLERLLDSIAIQRFRDFEVIVTDDSPVEVQGVAGEEDLTVRREEDGSVRVLCGRYQDLFPLSYFRNQPALGTPENWNEAIRRSQGQWIKIMHDDDWFQDESSLGQLAAAIADNPDATFIFSAYRDVFLDEGRTREMFVPAGRYKAFLKNKTVLFARNIIGPPSVVLYKKEGGAIFFDRTVKWVVDIEFYIRYLGDRAPVYIDKILINVGMGSQQVTRDCFRLRPVEIPENFYLLNKVGVAQLRNMMVYDAWWRLMRNLEIRSAEDITEAGYAGMIPAVIRSMVAWQRRVPLSMLRIGAFSKTLMFVHYITHNRQIGLNIPHHNRVGL